MFIVYETRNRVNGKIYVGVHRGYEGDSYFGSGRRLKQALSAYGIESFEKRTLGTYDTAEEAYSHEARIVTTEFLSRDDVYNLKRGGEGGFDWINESGIRKFHGHRHSEETKRSLRASSTGRLLDDVARQKIRESNARTNAERSRKVSLAKTGLKQTEETKRKISETLRRRNAEKRAHDV